MRTEAQVRAEIRSAVKQALALPEAAGKERLALQLVLDDSRMSLPQISAILTATPASSATAIERLSPREAGLKRFVLEGKTEAASDEAAFIKQGIALLPANRRRGE